MDRLTPDKLGSCSIRANDFIFLKTLFGYNLKHTSWLIFTNIPKISFRY